jgi:hypothetical protein
MIEWMPFGKRNPNVRELFVFENGRIVYDGTFDVRLDLLPIQRILVHNGHMFHVEIYRVKTGAATDDDEHTSITTLYYNMLDVCTSERLVDTCTKIIEYEKIKIDAHNARTIKELRDIIEIKRLSLDTYRPSIAAQSKLFV